ncbi:MAG: peptide chain release factor N(5)-glutamine methyltransferase [Thermanaerothrix sp.]|jgi:release factor glutamine methyltransferase|uniref:Release factor glutamine methyltransferase n=1 Tax=Thermanaerothrix solaris TaxID=3058434 RepID=A0ABU3NQX4_9CHLR|nr:peptide chain release factor N(5)-glutamine methyltransferase [Thermanaerothrix sp. 4228-RoL]MDT8899249.1 peptide chain release factor N(5)-glutamine methyltransferase [Thermanaerothrix sp. 4228-RoL]
MTTTITIAEWLNRAIQTLRPATETPAIEAQALLAHVLGLSRAYLLTHPEHPLNEVALESLEHLLKRLEQGEPLPYVLGWQEFYGLPIKVSPAVLIPRPETEMLVEYALAWLRENPLRRKAIDVGTGSGCIAIALAYHLPDLKVLALERSRAALQVARENLIQFGLMSRIYLIQADLLNPVGIACDLICANLPYIPSPRLSTLRVIQFEPREALDGGSEGLDLIRGLLEQAPPRLTSGGLLLAEIDASHADVLPSLARRFFPRARIEVRPDLAGLPRLLVIQT